MVWFDICLIIYSVAYCISGFLWPSGVALGSSFCFDSNFWLDTLLHPLIECYFAIKKKKCLNIDWQKILAPIWTQLSWKVIMGSCWVWLQIGEERLDGSHVRLDAGLKLKWPKRCVNCQVSLGAGQVRSTRGPKLFPENCVFFVRTRGSPMYCISLVLG